MLKGHTRPLTKVKFNREGDLLFTCAKDSKPTVWYSRNGERLGTYNGHEGTVWDCDIDFKSTRFLTGSADRTARLWDLQTGEELHRFQHKSSVRAVGFSHGDRMILSAQDDTFNQQPKIFIYNLAQEGEQQLDALRELSEDDHGRINCALWGSLNETVIAGCEDGSIRVWDVDQGQLKQSTDRKEWHSSDIVDMQFSKDQTMLITASRDRFAKVWDVKTLTCLKTFRSDRPLNAAAISPRFNQIILGGGQAAIDVTTTAAAAGHFETDFYHIVYEDKLGSIGGHFGPVNTLAFHPHGTAFASGSEDGYIRLHHFHDAYYKQSAQLNWNITGKTR